MDTNLNDYHQKQSARLAKKVSDQLLLSPEESMKQIQRLSNDSGRTLGVKRSNPDS